MLIQRATDADRKRAQENRDVGLAEIKKRQPSEAAFKRQLLAMGMSEEKFSARLYEEALFKEIVDREIRSKLTIADEDARKFFDENRAQFDLPERVQDSQIFLATKNIETGELFSDTQKQEKKQLSDKLLRRILAGEDFKKLAKEYSEDPLSRDNGGELPPLSRNNFEPILALAVFSMAPNQVSDVITSQIGFHIVKLHEKLPEQKASFSESSQQIKDYLSFQEPETTTRLSEKIEGRSWS